MCLYIDYNFDLSASFFQCVTNFHHLGRSNVDDDCHSIDCKCLYTWPSLMPNGEFKMKSFGAIASTSGIASSLMTGNNSMIPAFSSSAGREDVMKPPLERKTMRKYHQFNYILYFHPLFAVK